jgi:hypothetical protein
LLFNKVVMSIMEGNAVAPRLLAGLFNEWMHLISEEAEVFIQGFGSREPEPSLDEYREEIKRLTNAAETIRMTCTDDVRTGEY